jgi:hypothetical protein
MGTFTRDDVKKWIQENIVNECGCAQEDYSIHDTNMYMPEYNSDDLQAAVQYDNNPGDAACPDTYTKVADSVCQDPHAALEALRPIMQKIGVGCPQSFAKALFDIFSTAQDMGIIKSFNTEQ